MLYLSEIGPFKVTINENLKKQTNFSSKVVPAGFDFTVTKDTSMVAMHISPPSCKITYTKNYHSCCTTTMVATFIPSCQVYDLASSYLINKPVINSECNIQ